MREIPGVDYLDVIQTHTLSQVLKIKSQNNWNISTEII